MSRLEVPGRLQPAGLSLGWILLGAACASTQPALEPVGSSCRQTAAPQAQPPEAQAPDGSASQTGEQAAAQGTAKAHPFTLGGTEVHHLASAQTGRDYALAVRLPDSFATAPNKRYPVVYLLDAQWNFELVDRIASSLAFDQVLPDVLVVAITYAGDDPNFDALRREDFLPTRAKGHTGEVFGAGASSFLEFIEEDVIPFAESRFRADPQQRILSGASYGGLFVLHAMFERPGLFDGYFSMSPAVVWDNDWIFARQRAFCSEHTSIPAKLWLSVGAQEWPDYVQANHRFFQTLQQSGYEDLELSVRTIEGERTPAIFPKRTRGHCASTSKNGRPAAPPPRVARTS